MSAESVLDEALTRLLGKAHQELDVARPIDVRPASLNFDFGGDNTPIAAATTGSLKLMVPYPSRIVWARISAGDADDNPVAITGTIRVILTNFETFGAPTFLHGTGTIPTITADSVADCSLTGWHTNLVTGDWLIARLVTLTGAPTWVSLEILLRPTDVPIGVQGIVDGAGDFIVDNDGNRIVLRN